MRDDTSTPSYRAERGERPTDDAPEAQTNLSLGAMARGPVGSEAHDDQTNDDGLRSASDGAEEEREQAEDREQR